MQPLRGRSSRRAETTADARGCVAQPAPCMMGQTCDEDADACLTECDVSVDAIAVCPHAADDECECRKPNPGMRGQLEEQLGQEIDVTSSWMIGDKPSDIGFGQALGLNTGLIRSRYWNEVDSLAVRPDLVGDSLRSLVDAIAGQCR